MCWFVTPRKFIAASTSGLLSRLTKSASASRTICWILSSRQSDSLREITGGAPSKCWLNSHATKMDERAAELVEELAEKRAGRPSDRCPDRVACRFLPLAQDFT